jgi:hypothetical protein
MTVTYTASVPANVLWFNTGIKIFKGQYVTIQAAGIVNTWGGRGISNSDAGGQATYVCDDPGCPMRGALYGELIGRLGVGTPFRVGTNFDFTAPGPGALFLSVNDYWFKDNLGEFNVTVTVK